MNPEKPNIDCLPTESYHLLNNLTRHTIASYLGPTAILVPGLQGLPTVAAAVTTTSLTARVHIGILESRTEQ